MGGILVFTAGSSSGTTRPGFVSIMDDDFVEVTESFNVEGSLNVTGADVAFSGGVATVNIQDPDGQCSS